MMVKREGKPVKKIKIKWIVFGLVGVLLVLFFAGQFYERIDPTAVDKIVLKTYDHDSYGEKELTEEEARKLVFLYNTSRCLGDVNAEPCCASYGFGVYFKDGSHFYVGEGPKSKMIVNRGSGIRYYIENQALIDYILQLSRKYGLPT